jgi:hypothetical protein
MTQHPVEPLNQLKALHASLAAQVSRPKQLPEPAIVLNLAARRDSTVRLFTHLHQMCLGHAELFRATSQINLLYLIDGYVRMAEGQNPLGMYGSARALLEFSAFIHEVCSRLKSAASQPKEKWRQAGEEFFAIVVRARHGTSSPEKADLVRKAGAPAGAVKPFHIIECIKNLVKEPGNESATGRYDHLCDFVHHNLSSQTLGNAGSTIRAAARSSGGGAIVFPKPGPITQFQYPLPSKAKMALDDTGPFAHFDATISVKWINLIPGSPYSPEHVFEITGSRLGMLELRPPRRPKPVSPYAETKVGRNQQCPCGSGKKYKKCCGADLT